MLSVVIPAYNEAERIHRSLTIVCEWAKARPQEVEVIVVDDGSTDSTVDVVGAFLPHVRLIRNGTNRGKGYSVAHGVRESRGESVLFSDADLSTPITEYELLAKALVNADIAIGSRGMKQSNIERRQPFYRQSMGRTFNRIVQLLTLRGIQDTQCGFKLFRGDIARQLFSEITISGFAFDVEVLYLAQQKGFRVVEVPVTWVNDERTHVHAIYDSYRMLRDVIRIRRLHGPRKP
jgi:dolichyl-phosphate beta-glucosyltransferase